MRVLFVSHTAYLPELKRGTEVNTDLLIRELQRLGCEAMVLCGLHSRGAVGKWASLRLRAGDPTRAVSDRSRGYLTFRAWDVDAALDRTLDLVKPDVVVVQAGYIHRVAHCQDRGFACIYYEHAANELADPQACRCSECTADRAVPGRGRAVDRNSVVWVACSSFLGHYHGDPFGVAYEVVNPIIIPEHCRAYGRDSRTAVFVGIKQLKGADKVLELAKTRPDAKFEIFDNIPQKTAEETRLASQLAQLSNVVIRKPLASAGVYRNAKIVLMPSRWEEPWGRVASEAHINAIPVLASTRGGLPESVGPGGVCVDFDAPISEWNQAFSRLWDDAGYHRSLSDAAMAYAQRHDFQPNVIAEKFFSLLQRAGAKRDSTPAGANNGRKASAAA